MRLRWSRRALADIARMHEYLATRNPPAAARLEARIRKRAENLLLAPLSAPALGVADLHRALVSHAPYTIVYRVRGDDLIVVAVLHQAQDA